MIKYTLCVHTVVGGVERGEAWEDTFPGNANLSHTLKSLLPVFMAISTLINCVLICCMYGKASGLQTKHRVSIVVKISLLCSIDEGKGHHCIPFVGLLCAPNHNMPSSYPVLWYIYLQLSTQYTYPCETPL